MRELIIGKWEVAYYLRQSLRREDSAGETLVPELGWKLRMMGIKRVGFRKEDEVLDTCVSGLEASQPAKDELDWSPD